MHRPTPRPCWPRQKGCGSARVSPIQSVQFLVEKSGRFELASNMTITETALSGAHKRTTRELQLPCRPDQEDLARRSSWLSKPLSRRFRRKNPVPPPLPGAPPSTSPCSTCRKRSAGMTSRHGSSGTWSGSGREPWTRARPGSWPTTAGCMKSCAPSRRAATTCRTTRPRPARIWRGGTGRPGSSSCRAAWTGSGAGRSASPSARTSVGTTPWASSRPTKPARGTGSA